MTDKRLKSFADRLDNLEEERKGIVGDIKDVFTEVKSAGYNPKALRKVLAERRKKTDAELEADMELYRAALAEPGATYRSVAEKTGVPRSTLHRLVPRKQNGTDASAQLRAQIPTSTDPGRLERMADEIDRDLVEAADVHMRGIGKDDADTGTHSGGDAQPVVTSRVTTEPGGDSCTESCGEPAAALGAKALARSFGLTTAPLRPHDAETMASPEPETSSEGALSHSRASCGDHSRTDTCGEARGEARPNPDGLDIPPFLQRSRQEGRV